MSDKIKFFDLRFSPNNIKVRIALNYKGIEFETIPVEFNEYPPAASERTAVVEATGQPLTPAILHGQTALFGTAAILRYLDANFRKTPYLFSADFATMKQIEEWESFAVTELPGPIGTCFQQVMGKEIDSSELRRASGILNEVTGRVEKQLATTPWLAGNQMTAADVTAAPFVSLGMLPAEAAQGNSIGEFFQKNLHLGDGREKTRAWIEKVMVFNR